MFELVNIKSLRIIVMNDYRYEIKNLKIVYEYLGERHISWSIENIVNKKPLRSFYYEESLERATVWLKENHPELFI
jgi:hypothetical protein